MATASMLHSEGKQLAKQLFSCLEATTELIRYFNPSEMETLNINRALPEEMLEKIF